MATIKHMNYDSDEAMTLRGSKIPKAIMASEGTRFDSAEDASVFFARELDHVKAQSYDVEYPELTALHLFPQSSEADPGAETITYYTYDKTGLAKIIDNYSTDLPRADVTGKPSFAKSPSATATATPRRRCAPLALPASLLTPARVSPPATRSTRSPTRLRGAAMTSPV